MEGRKYVEAPLHRRFLASLADLALFLFVFLGIFAIFEAAFSASDWYKGAHQRTEALLSESLLFVQGEDGEWGAPTGAKDYLAYQDLLLSYYEEGIHETVPEEAPDLKGRSLAYWYNVNVIGLEDIDRVYGYLELSSPAKEKGKELFQWPLLPDGTVDKGGLAVPADKLFQSGSAYDEEGNARPLANLTEEGREDLLLFFYDESGASPSVYYNVAESFFSSSPYQSLLNEEKAIRRAYPMAIGLAIAFPLVYLLPTLLFRNGETIGKKALRIGLVNTLGYQVTRPQMCLRTLPSYFFGAIILLFVPQETAALAILLGVLLLSYLLSLFTNGHRAIHDYIGATIAVDMRSSSVYRSRAEEEAAEELIRKAGEEGEHLLEAGEKALEEERKEEG